MTMLFCHHVLASSLVQPELRWHHVRSLPDAPASVIPIKMLHYLAAFAALKLARYIQKERIEVLCLSGDSARDFCVPLLLGAYEAEGMAATAFPELLYFNGASLGHFYEDDDDLSETSPARRAQEIFKPVSTRYACFVDDHVNDGIKAFHVCKILKPHVNPRFKYLTLIARGDHGSAQGSIPLVAGFRVTFGGLYGLAWDFSGFCKGEHHIDGTSYQKEHAINIIKAMAAVLTFEKLSFWARQIFWLRERFAPSPLGQAAAIFGGKAST